jgi:hypothetical protein
MAIPVKEGRYRLMLVMCALTLLDCTQSKVLDSIVLVIHKFRLLITHVTGSPSSQVEITKQSTKHKGIQTTQEKSGIHTRRCRDYGGTQVSCSYETDKPRGYVGLDSSHK